MRRNEGNIGETNQTSVRVHHNPGGQSNWSLGWGEEEKKPQQQNQSKVNRNESHFQMGDGSQGFDEEKKQQKERRKKEQELNEKMPTYNPKQGGKSSLSFGNEPTDYRKKDEVFTSVKVHNPPGGRSNIQFG